MLLSSTDTDGGVEDSVDTEVEGPDVDEKGDTDTKFDDEDDELFVIVKSDATNDVDVSIDVEVEAMGSSSSRCSVVAVVSETD